MRQTAKHDYTFSKGELVCFRGSNEGPFPVTAVREIPDGPDEFADPEDMWPRDAVGHHQHVTLTLDDCDGCGVSEHVYSGAWLKPNGVHG